MCLELLFWWALSCQLFSCWRVAMSLHHQIIKIQATLRCRLLLRPPLDYSHIIMPITQKGFPKTYDRWGKEWIDKINLDLPKAVNFVAQKQNCDEPIDADLSDNKSIPKKKLFFGLIVKTANAFMFIKMS